MNKSPTTIIQHIYIYIYINMIVRIKTYLIKC